MKTINSCFKKTRSAVIPVGAGVRHFPLAAILAAAALASTHAATEVFNTEGTTMWVCPAGVTEIQVECWGGGGSGGTGRKTNSTAGNTSQNGGGGGGGAHARRASVPVTPGNPYTITIPAAAVSGANGTFGGNYSHGESVTFVGDSGVTVTAAGGSGGQNAYANANYTSRGVGGAGGTVAASEGDVVFAGGNGANGTTGSTNYSGGGGGAAGDSSDGSNGSGTIGGSGGTAGGGAGGNGRGTGNTNDGPGGDGIAPGGGGGGAKNRFDGTEYGGTGGLGQIRISYPETPAVKADNADDLNLTSSWVGGEVPSGLATWDNTVMAANTTVLGADLAFEAIAIENPGGLVTINAGNTLTLNGVGTVVDMSAATADLTLNCDLLLAGGSSWDVTTGRTATVAGAVSGGAGFTKLGDGTVILSGANTYTGLSSVVSGTLQLGAADVIPDGGSAGGMIVDGTLDLNGNPETVNNLAGSGVVDNSGGTAATLTVDAGGASSFGGTLQNSGSPLNLVKTGNSTFSLGGANSYTGATAISAGTLQVGHLDALASTSGITVAGGARLTPAVAGLTIGAPISLGSSGTTSQIYAVSGGAGTVTFNGAIGGAGNLLLNQPTGGNADGRIVLGAQSTYLGTTKLDTTNTGARLDVRLGIANALPTSTVLTLDGGPGSGSGRNLRLDLNGFDQTLAGLTNVTGLSARNQRVINSGAPATLTINNSDPYFFGGSQSHTWNSNTYTTRARIEGPISLVKSGVGAFSLVEVHTYEGDTTVSEGALSLGGINPSNESSTVTIADSGATLDLDFTGADTVGKLFVGATQLAAGVYKAVGSAAAGTELAQLTGIGTLTVTTGPNDYAAWAALFPGADLADPAADLDGDGRSNDDERLFGLDPTNPGSLNPISIPFDTAAGTLAFTRRDDALTGKFTRVETSTDLVMWTVDGGAVLAPGAPINDIEEVLVTLSPALLTGPKLFVRIVQDDGILLSEDFEADNGGFTVATTAGSGWAHGDPDSSGLGGVVTGGNGGSANCWGTNIGNPGYFLDGTVTCLRSVPIDLTGVTAAEITFAEALDLEAGDTAVVNIIDDTTDTVIEAAIYSPVDGIDNSANWAPVGPIAMPASALGNVVRLEWCLTGFGGASDDYMGWYIDDVSLRQTMP